MDYIKHPITLKLLGRMWVLIRPYKLKFLVNIGVIVVSVILSLAQPLLWAKILTSLYNQNLNELYKFTFYFIIFFLIQTLVNLGRAHLFSFLNESIILNLKQTLYKKIMNLSIYDFDKIGVSEFISKLHNDTEVVADVIVGKSVHFIVNLLTSLAIGITLFFIEWKLALLIVALIPVLYLIIKLFSKHIKARSTEASSINDYIYFIVQQSFIGIKEIRNLNIRDQNLINFGTATEELKSKKIRIVHLQAISQNLAQIVSFIIQILIILIGAYLVVETKTLSIEIFIALNTYSFQLINSLMQVTEFNTDFQRLVVSLERIFAVMDRKEYKFKFENNGNSENLKGSINFKNVFFSYETDRVILDNVSFEIAPFSKTAIVGRSGAGKSTIFNILLRFYSPISGQIYIDDYDLQEIDEISLRKYITLVQQAPYFFGGSIKENLLVANPDTTIEDLYEACKKAYIHDVIINLPNGYETIIGENGTNLSGGEKQRLAIARAILRNTRIILLDEPTSSVDNESQYFINSTLNLLSHNHTIVIIAHHLSNVIDCDKIIILDQGKVIESGIHTSLTNNKNYIDLFNSEMSI
ncbi:ABC transporter ATP-binding protein [Paenibacillus sp. CH40]|uniref:ABC transporter ATP-binding protein n=1 Tax=Paenibacillus sp. CH40 TaxID=2962045 RepID=UPI0020B7ADAD|nr:ABC transporter ATP-binding protein [Paenibacillus sp. CH40]MCP3794901.1 ABC transporter ATP-binding protein/permease [Paenibacillus sp. CH40]